MNPEIKNFAEIEKFIKERPKEAGALAGAWQGFINEYEKENPEILAIGSKEEFLVWATQHPEKHIDTNIWVGKEVVDFYFYLRRQQEDSMTQAQGSDDKKEEREKEKERERKKRDTKELIKEYLRQEKEYRQPAQPRPGEFFGNVRTRISNIGRGSYRVGGRLASQGGRATVSAGSRTIGTVGRMASQMAIRMTTQMAMATGRAAVTGLVSNPIGWIAIAVIIAIMLIVFLIIMFAGGGGIGGGGCSSFLDKKVFVTSTKSNGNLVAYVKNNIDSAFSGDGLQAGDRICQWRADNSTPSPLGGTWTAWLSTNTQDAKDRIADQKYVRAECDEVIVADNKADLINGDIDRPIAKDENGNTLKDVGVWTGTDFNGQRIVNDNCSSWTVGDPSEGGMTGDSGSRTEIWTSFFSEKCDQTNYHLYCFEQGASPPTPAP